jgi:hypothetical protein
VASRDVEPLPHAEWFHEVAKQCAFLRRTQRADHQFVGDNGAQHECRQVLLMKPAKALAKRVSLKACTYTFESTR